MAMRAAMVSMPSHRFWRRMFSLGACWLSLWLAYAKLARGGFGLEGAGGELALAVLVEVGGHGLRHDVAVETHLEVEGAGGGVAGGGGFGIGGDAGVVDDLL